MSTVNFTPREIVSELDRFIIGQKNAKRSVAIALRNRWRRSQVVGDLKEEISPKNIIMIGPTGVGKTEIARRISKLVRAPFIKVEASKFTEVGYIGKDVESMIRELTDLSVKMVREEELEKVQMRAQEVAEEKLLDLLLPPKPRQESFEAMTTTPTTEEEVQKREREIQSREKMRKMFREGKLDGREVEMQSQPSRTTPMVEVFAARGMEDLGANLREMLGNVMPQHSKPRKVKLPEAFELLIQEEAAKLVDMENVKQLGVTRVEQNGIVFLDEIDKIAGREGGHGPDVSREGVQRDILPIVEGSNVMTKHGMVRTDHILFIASGAFHVSKPSDLIPELQGRFPIRVELDSLNEGDFYRILTETENSLIKQYEALMETEGVTLRFSTEGIREICRIAAVANEKMENIGARRLHTVLELLLDEISFTAPESSGQKIEIDANYVTGKLSEVIKDQDLSRYIL